MTQTELIGKQGRITKNSDGKEWDYLVGQTGEIMKPLHIYGFQDVSGLVSIQLGKTYDIMNRVNVPITDIELIN